ncbi:MAG: ABC transporter permease [Anaeroplasmataceae bacterium]
MMEVVGWKKVLPKVLKVLFVVLAMFIMYIPVFVIIYQSFNSDANAMQALHFGKFTFQNYKEIFTNASLYRNILDSLLVSFWATLIATVLGLFSSIGINALKGKSKKAMSLLNEMPMIQSEIVTGISIMLIFSFLLPIIPHVFGFPTMLIAHVFFTTPYVILMVLPKLQQTDESLFEAAQDLGCSRIKSLFMVIIPSLKTAILTGALLAFTLSIDDFVISYFTQGNGFYNFSNYVYNSYTKKNFSAGAYAYNALLTMVTLGIVLFASIKTSQKSKKKVIK